LEDLVVRHVLLVSLGVPQWELHLLT